MALCPLARHRLIPAGSNDPSITAVGAVLHVDAGNAESLYAYFNGPSGGIESHFHIAKDGTIEQYRDTSREADANYKGNSWVSGGRRYGLISIETQGYGSGEWTSAQMTSIKRLLAWLSSEHNFPLQKASSWQGPGVGYHIMFGAPGPWTPVAKECPGYERIEQFDDEIVPWMSSGADPQEDELKPDERDALLDLHKAVSNGNRIQVLNPHNDERTSLRYAVEKIREQVWRLWYRKWSKPGFQDEQPQNAMWFSRVGYRHSREGKIEGRERGKDIRKLNKKVDTLLAAQDGLDQDALLARIDQRSEEDAARDAELQERIDSLSDALDAAVEQRQEMRDLIEQHYDGSLDAAAVLAQMGELLRDASAEVVDDGDGDAA